MKGEGVCIEADEPVRAVVRSFIESYCLRGADSGY